MPRLLRLIVAMLPLALGTAAVDAQESRPGGRGAHAGGAGAVQSQGPRELRQRESLMQQSPRRREQEPVQAPPPRSQQDRRALSDAVRHVQRTTGGQILGAEQVPFEGRNITRVKYMDERGRVRYMDAPPPSERRVPRRAANDAP